MHRSNRALDFSKQSAGRVLALFPMLVLLALIAFAIGAIAPLILVSTSTIDAPCATPYVNPSPYDELIYHRAYAEGPNVSARAAGRTARKRSWPVRNSSSPYFSAT